MTNVEPIELRIEVAPWPRDVGTEAPPREELQLACVYEVYVGIDHIDEAAYLRRTDTHDELWTRFLEFDRNPSLVARAPRGGEAGVAARRLFRNLYRRRAGFAAPTGWQSGPLVDETTFGEVMQALKDGWRRNADAARARETPIIRAARRLGLDPEPTGTSPTAWQARCPTGGHYLHISGESDTFGCDYCRRKGGEAELETFVAGRRTPRRG